MSDESGVIVDKPREACGVFGVFAPGAPVAHLTYLGLYALQHRGQESAGIAVSDGATVTVVKDMGLVASALEDRILAALEGGIAIGHTRYSTTGSSSWRASQPFYRDVGDLEFALGHNGNLVNTAELAASAGMLDGTVVSDSDLVAELVATELLSGDLPEGRELETALARVLPRLEGGFSFVVMDQDHLVAVRDPHGFWPLCLGRLDNGWVVASETPALDTVGAHVVREVEPGEMIVVDRDGWRSEHPFAEPDPRLCVFEFVYFSRPDSVLYGRNVHLARQRMGELLSDQASVEADVVMPVPESGIPAAQGYSRASGIAYRDGLVKNRYIGRTFIAPTQEMRALGVRMKLNVIRENVAGQRLVVVDDSIVRGTTTRAIVEMLRSAGAAEVHMRISSPPYRWPCFYGMDTGSRSELLAANLSVEEIREYLGVDSIAYLGLDRLVEATGTPGSGFCTACLTGEYPIEIPATIGREVLGRRVDEPGGSFVATDQARLTL
jgi:amidophosphoribosyltransferase